LLKIVGEVGAKYGVTAEALRAAHRRYTANGGKQHGNDLLTDKEEAGLVALARAAATAHVHMRPVEVIEVTRQVFKRSPQWDGWSWYEGLRGRHPDVFRHLTTKPIKANRVDPVAIDEVEAMIEQMGPLIRSGVFADHAILVADESLFYSSPHARAGVCIAPKNCTADFVLNRDYPKGSILPFAAANGEVVAVFLVMEAKSDGRKNFEPGVAEYKGYVVEQTGLKSEGPPVFYLFTSSGRVNAAAWTSMLECVHEVHERTHPGTTKLLICDVLDVHQAWTSLSKWIELGNRTVFVANGCTAWAQVLDQFPFALFRKEITRLARASPVKAFTAGEMVPIVYKAVQASLTRRAIVDSFRSTGTFPFNPSRLRQLARLVTVGPSSSSAEGVAAEAAAALVLRRSGLVAAPKNAKKVAATVLLNRVYNDFELIAWARSEMMPRLRRSGQRQRRSVLGEKRHDCVRRKRGARKGKRPGKSSG
jgi:hypothetical protein